MVRRGVLTPVRCEFDSHPALEYEEAENVPRSGLPNVRQQCFGDVAHAGRAPPLQGGGSEFESRLLHTEVSKDLASGTGSSEFGRARP